MYMFSYVYYYVKCHFSYVIYAWMHTLHELKDNTHYWFSIELLTLLNELSTQVHSRSVPQRFYFVELMIVCDFLQFSRFDSDIIQTVDRAIEVANMMDTVKQYIYVVNSYKIAYILCWLDETKNVNINFNILVKFWQKKLILTLIIFTALQPFRHSHCSNGSHCLEWRWPNSWDWWRMVFTNKLHELLYWSWLSSWCKSTSHVGEIF